MKDILHQGGFICGTIILLFQSYFYIIQLVESTLLNFWQLKGSNIKTLGQKGITSSLCGKKKDPTKTHSNAESLRSGKGKTSFGRWQEYLNLK